MIFSVDIAILLFFSLFFISFSPKVVGQLAEQMIGYNLATKQTPKEGVKVNKVIWMLLVIFCVCVKKKKEENHTLVFGRI